MEPDFVRRLVAAQFPAWAALAVVPVLPRGADNALFRLGADMVVRMPCTPRSTVPLAKERVWLPRLGPLLPLPVPQALADGAPGGGYPFPWCVHRSAGGRGHGHGAGHRPGAAGARPGGLPCRPAGVDPAGGPDPGTHNA